MGQSDWSYVGSGLSIATVERGVTGAITPPNGGGSFVFACNSLSSTVTGAVALYTNLSGFAPTGTGPAVADGGTSIRGCLKRVQGPGATGFSPFLFACLQGSPPTVNDYAYMLGLGDSNPYEIMLCKGLLSGGLNASDENITVLARSTAQYAFSGDAWHHLKLDAIVEPNGEVVLQVFENDLAVHPIGSAPTWVAVPGCAEYIDDRNQINTGSAPLLGGCAGFGFAVAESLNRRAAFDAIQVGRL
jgi:hypothetical protein